MINETEVTGGVLIKAALPGIMGATGVGIMVDRHRAAALAGSAAVATHAFAAPSIRTALGIDHKQPWRWVIHPDSIELYADGSRRQAAMDPHGHLMLLGCGGALHHARVVLAAEGYTAEATLLPDPHGAPDRVATVTAGEPIEVTAEAKALYEAIGPHVRRPIADTPMPLELLDPIIAAAEAEGVWLRVLDRDEVMEMAAATSISRIVRERIGRERSNAFAVLYGRTGTAEGWLHAGQAFSAVWLTATVLGIVVVPSSAVLQLPGPGAVTRRLLAGRGTPYLALRLGVGR
jgi:hypothetical protein